MRRALAASIAVASAFAPLTASADPRVECVQAADRGQTQRDQGKLEEAKESFVFCARDVCPAVVANHCTTWLSEVEHVMPTLSFRAFDETGQEIVDVKVLVDDKVKVASLDGRAVTVDPGLHRIRFVRPGDLDTTLEIVVHVGDKARPVEAHLQKLPSAPPPVLAKSEAPKRNFRFPLLAGVSFGVGAASFITMGVLVGTTASDVNHLRATCAGSCNPSDVSSANTRIAMANVAMGVGILGVVGGGLDLLLANLGHHEASSSPEAALSVRLALTGGAISGTF